MRCPYCTHQDSRVVDSREAADSVRRRRECLKCGKRFTTHERAEASALMIVKKDGRREAFSREKLRTGLRKACQKRPVGEEILLGVVEQIEAELRSKQLPEVSSQLIGDLVMRHLKKLDKVAYIRFASVYRDFSDITTFKKELRKLE